MALIDGLNAIGNAIREKNGTTELIPFKDMPQAILDIVGGEVVQKTLLDRIYETWQVDRKEYPYFLTIYSINSKTAYLWFGKVYTMTDNQITIGPNILNCLNITVKVNNIPGDIMEYLLGYLTPDSFYKAPNSSSGLWNLSPDGYYYWSNIGLNNVGSNFFKLSFGGNAKEEQEKTINITENGTTVVLPDDNKTLSKVTVDVQVESSEEAVDLLTYITTASTLFNGAKSFPSKAAVNLPNATSVYRTFGYWSTAPVPIVEELTVNAPNISVSNQQSCMGQMFAYNNGVKKVVLNMPDESQYMNSTFQGTTLLEELTLNFSTRNIKNYENAFANSKVKSIIGVLDFSSATNVNSMFASCSNLEDVIFAPNTLSISVSLSNSGKLTNGTKESIFNGLAQLEAGVTKTLTLNANVKILQSQVDSANAKGWTVAGGTVVSEEEYYG